MSIPESSFETARYILAMAQEGAKQWATDSKVPVTIECGIAESERKDAQGNAVAGYEVAVRFFIPHAIADAVADDTTH